ncbi:MAG: hypothetical protein F6K41_11670, partial [Symploca sp. SIO3E6]|nr:hypothetical protein [Caldora sp. SIO3E6]
MGSRGAEEQRSRGAEEMRSRGAEEMRSRGDEEELNLPIPNSQFPIPHSQPTT